MAKQPFKPCPLSSDLRMGSPKCIWDLVRVLEVNADRTKQRAQYRCRFCNDVKEKVERT